MILIPEKLTDYCSLLEHVATSYAMDGDVAGWRAQVHHLLRHLACQQTAPDEQRSLELLSGYATGLAVSHGARWIAGDRAEWMQLAQMIAGAAGRRAA